MYISKYSHVAGYPGTFCMLFYKFGNTILITYYFHLLYRRKVSIFRFSQCFTRKYVITGCKCVIKTCGCEVQRILNSIVTHPHIDKPTQTHICWCVSLVPVLRLIFEGALLKLAGKPNELANNCRDQGNTQKLHTHTNTLVFKELQCMHSWSCMVVCGPHAASGRIRRDRGVYLRFPLLHMAKSNETKKFPIL